MSTEPTEPTETSWAHLPNAKYIDLIRSSMMKNPRAWNSIDVEKTEAQYYSIRRKIRETAGPEAHKVAREAASSAAAIAYQSAGRYTSIDTAWTAALDAVLALFLWNDCGYLLRENPEDVKMKALLGNKAAVLIYPACLALHNSKRK
jgi:hypothetical protein